MKIFNQSIGICILSLLITSCSSQLNYTPKVPNNEVNCVDEIKQVLEEQIKNTPEEVIVTSKYIKIKTSIMKRSVWTGGIASQPKTTTIFFESIGKIKLFQKRSYYIIQILSKNGRLKYKLILYDNDTAESFIDCMYAMMKRNSL